MPANNQKIFKIYSHEGKEHPALVIVKGGMLQLKVKDKKRYFVICKGCGTPIQNVWDLVNIHL